MNTVDFSKLKFHPSDLKKLMTAPRSKSETLSETAKGCLHEIYIAEVFGRKKVVSSPAMQKGTSVETDSLELLQSVTGEVYFKNQKTLENDYLIGTPDVIDKKGGRIIDIKSSWDIWTFSRVTEGTGVSDYYYQLLGYMWLTDTKKAQLVYALVNTPEYIINDELYRLSFKVSPETNTDDFKVNYLFDDIDSKMKIKRYDVEFSQDTVDLVKARLETCRLYLQGLTL